MRPVAYYRAGDDIAIVPFINRLSLRIRQCLSVKRIINDM